MTQSASKAELVPPPVTKRPAGSSEVGGAREEALSPPRVATGRASGASVG